MDPDSTLSYIEDILGAIANIEEDIAGLDKDTFTKNRRARQLLERNVEIISEASRRLPDDLRAGEQSIPWPQVRAIGNILRHEYRAVVANVLWDTATRDIPALKRSMLRMIENLGRTNDDPPRFPPRRKNQTS